MAKWSVIQHDGPTHTLEADSIQAGDYGVWFVKDNEYVAFVSSGDVSAIIQEQAWTTIEVRVEAGDKLVDAERAGEDVGAAVIDRLKGVPRVS